MFSHRRSCKACIKAKRRCDLDVPQCGRCLTKATFCSYENEPSICGKARDGTRTIDASRVSAASRVIESPVASRLSETEALVVHSTFSAAPHRLLKHSSPTPAQSTHLSLTYEPSLPEIKWRNNKTTIQCLACTLKEFPAMFVREGRTPFVHHHLYRDHFPKPIKDANYVCEIYQSIADHQVTTVLPIIQLKLRELIEFHRTSCSFDDILVSVQALMLHLILCLFNDNASLRKMAEEHYALLGRWTHKLWQQVPSLISSSLNPWQAWLFAESVRRTILISHLIRGVYSSIKQGYHAHTLFVEALPFDSDTLLWDARSVEEWETLTPAASPHMVSYREYVTGYAIGTVHPIGVFESLLLVACYGKDNFEGLRARRQALLADTKVPWAVAS